MLDWSWEDVDVSTYEGDEGEGSLVLPSGDTIFWTTDEEGDRMFYIETSDGPLSIYEPSRYEELPVIAALAIENVFKQREGRHGRGH